MTRGLGCTLRICISESTVIFKLDMSSMLTQRNDTRWITGVISRDMPGFPSTCRSVVRFTQLWWQPESPWTSGNGSKLWPWWMWSFWTPGEKCVLTAGKELLRISESYQLKKQFMRTTLVSAWGMIAFWCWSNFHMQTELSEQQSLGALWLSCSGTRVSQYNTFEFDFHL